MTNNTNPYEAPKSSVEVQNDRVSQSDAPFFTTSTLKLCLMSMGTLGIYDLYWFYKNWVLIKERTGQYLIPFWRAFFSPIWIYSCFKHIKDYATTNNIQNSLPVVPLTIAYIIIQIIAQAPESPLDIIAFLGFLVLIPANTLALRINKENNPDFINNEDFSVLNWVAVIFGGILFIVLLFATINPLLFESVMDQLLETT